MASTQEGTGANAAGSSAPGNTAEANGTTVKKTRKELAEEKRRREEEAAAEEARRLAEEEEARKREQEELEKFRQSDRANLEIIHAFGTFTGSSNLNELLPGQVPLKYKKDWSQYTRANPSHDVFGHV